MCLSKFISQINTNNSWIVSISPGEFFGAVKEFILRVLPTPPQSISIIIGTAPLRSTSMIVENDHEADFSECLNSDIEDLHGGLADQIRIGFQVFRIYNIIIEIELKGICESDTVHFKLKPDIKGDISQGSAFKPVYCVSAHMTTRPITSC